MSRTLIHSVKLELMKLNTYFNQEDKDSSNSKPGVLTIVSAHERPLAGSAADGPDGHYLDNHYRDCGFGKAYTQTHDPVNGTLIHSSPPPHFSTRIESMPSRDSFRSTSQFGQNPIVSLGKLPKLHFPTFEGDNPKLWKSRYENYFEMYEIGNSVWVKVATMHFEGPVTCWLQSVDHRVHTANWSELCS
jgi:hypothetical protein